MSVVQFSFLKSNAIFHVKISLTASTNHIAKRAYNDNNNKEALIICILVSSSVS